MDVINVWSLNLVAILMMSAELGALDLLKIKVL